MRHLEKKVDGPKRGEEALHEALGRNAWRGVFDGQRGRFDGVDAANIRTRLRTVLLQRIMSVISSWLGGIGANRRENLYMPMCLPPTPDASAHGSTMKTVVHSES